MLGLNQMKKLIYLSVFLVGFGISSVAWGGAEVSGHFGMKFGSKINLQELTGNPGGWSDQTNMPWHFGLDAVYRHMMGDTGSFGLGIRYRLALTGEREYEGTDSSNDTYKFTHNRVALLANYRFHIDQFFVGPVLGLDIWKHLKFSYNIASVETDLMSSQFLWNQITGHAGLELGYQVTGNLLVKLEAGYDLSSFGFSGAEHCKRDNGNCGTSPIEPKEGLAADAEFESEHKLKLNAFYMTLGIGWFFG